MAKLTLLDMVQNILTALDSDDVNSIVDTEESISVATTIKEAYFRLVSDHDWPFLKELTNLEGLADVSNPTKMHIPDTVNKIFWVKYDKVAIEYVPPEQFKDLIDNRVVQTGVVDANGYVINAGPSYWTSYDDQYIYFDAIDLVTDTTMQSSKAVVYAIKVPTWTHSNTFVPDLPEKFFPTLLAEAKATCFLNFKQQANQREEGNARRGRVRMKNEAIKVDKAEKRYNEKSNYGRC